MLSRYLTQYAEQKYRERQPLLEGIQEALAAGFSGCSREEAVLMKFFYGTMPLRDAGEYDFCVFLSFVRHAIWLRKHVAWCEALPEDIFVNYVLYYRINSESIRENRAFFYGLLKDRIADRKMEEAVLAVNYWCAEHVTYQSSDLRTASPTTLLKSGRGRCGEESVFTVTALRSIGIPARQVYTPVWAHCDDNHAWVEVWLEGNWHFLGACEPEEILDKGWFLNASSRAMLVHCRSFSDFVRETEECVGTDGAVCLFNRTAAYARTGRLTVSIKDEKGFPAKGAKVRFEILNAAEYAKAAELTASGKGEVSITLGLGDVHIRAKQGDRAGETWINVTEDCRADIIIRREDAGQNKVECRMREVRAPEDYPKHAGIVTRKQRREKSRKTMLANRRRQESAAAFYCREKAEEFPEEMELLRMAGGNFEELYAFLKKDKNPNRRTLLRTLRTKDLWDAGNDVLEDALNCPRGVLDEKAWKSFVLCPWIWVEELTVYRSFIQHFFKEQEKTDFRECPEKIWEYIGKNITYEPKFDYDTICATPIGCLKLKHGNPMSRKILFTAICRTLGIPAGINRITQEAEYASDVCGSPVWHPIQRPQCGVGELVLTVEHGRRWNYHQNYTIGRLEGGEFVTQNYENIRFENDRLVFVLEAGYYRLITSLRLPNGNQHLTEYVFRLEDGEKKEIFMTYRETAKEDMLVCHELPDFDVTDKEGREKSMRSLLGDNDAILCFPEEGTEPTEHVLLELLQQADDFKRLKARLLFILSGEAALDNAALRRVTEEIPNVEIYFDPSGEAVQTAARRMYADPERLPFLLAVRGKMTGIYASCGYNAGSVALLLRLFC